MATLVPEFPVERVVPAEGYEEVTEEVPIGFAVVQVILTLQLLAPEAIAQEVGAGVRVPDMLPPAVQALPLQPVPATQLAVAVL